MAFAATAISNSRRWVRLDALSGFTTTPILVARGIRSSANSSCFPGSPSTSSRRPVTLPSGRASLLIKPKRTGSASIGHTIGTVFVAALAATAACTMPAKITSILERNHLFGESRQALKAALGPSIFPLEVAALDVAVRAHPFLKGSGELGRRRGRASSKHTDPSRRLVQCLGERWERRCRRRDRRAAGQRYELAALHSITSSARNRSVGGIVIPIAIAVFRFTASSNLDGCSIGRSAGFVPRSTLSTRLTTCRKQSRTRGP